MTTRRRFIAGLGSATVAGLAPPMAAARDSTAPCIDTTDEPEFLLEPGLIHLNSGTLGLMPRRVRERMAAATRQFEGNPVVQGYRDDPGTVLTLAEAARARLAGLLHCGLDELLVTHGTSDALGQVAACVELGAGDRILTSSAEHDGGVLCWHWLARRRGASVDVVRCPAEETDTAAIVERFAQAMRPETKVVCVSDVVAWTGLRMPIRELAALAHAHGALMVVDGAQALGHVPVDVAELGVDAYAASGHKWLLGPKGTGVLYVKPDPARRIFPVAWEGGTRLMSEAMGGCPLPQAIGLGAAAEDHELRGPAAEFARNVALRNQLWEALGRLKRVTPVGPPPGPQATALLGFRLPADVDAVAVRKTLLAEHGISVRSVDPKQWNGLRASLHVYNDAAQVQRLVEALRGMV
jgi:selenocysteine lyase/cysteine desulfurase